MIKLRIKKRLDFEEIERWRKERGALLDQRRDELARSSCSLPDDFFSDFGLPRFPWAWFGGHLVLLKPTSNHSENIFGGAIHHSLRGVPRKAKLHQTLSLCPRSLGLSLPPSLTKLETLPLLYPFKHGGGELTYELQSNSTLKIIKLEGDGIDKDWPYPNFSEVIPEKSLSVSDSTPAPFVRLLPLGDTQTLSVQDLPEGADQCLVVVVTANHKELGFDLMGADAEAERLQIVFLVNPAKQRVWTYNQCT